MALSTYSELVSAIDSWFMGRSLSAQADDIIALVTGYFNIKLRLREMETITDLSPTAGVYTLPTDYVEYKRVVEKASMRRSLAYISENAVDQMYPDRAGGLSMHFNIIGNSLYTFPLSTNNVELTYYKQIPLLSGSSTTNWLLTKHPGLYLHACQLYAAEFVKDDAEISKESTFVQNYIDLLHSADNRSKFASAGIVLPGTVW
jgi:hypothetical protein